VKHNIALTKVMAGLALGLALALAGCSSSSKKPEPAALPAASGALAVSKVWNARLGEVTTPLQATVIGTRVVLAATQGQVVELDADTGREIWRQQLNASLIAGVGSDGKRHAVVTSDNELVVLEAGRELWRQKLSAQTFTSPLVAGERVFVQTADRSVLAYEALSPLDLERRLGLVGDVEAAAVEGRVARTPAETGRLGGAGPSLPCRRRFTPVKAAPRCCSLRAMRCAKPVTVTEVANTKVKPV